MEPTTIPPFEPHPLLRGGHVQTIAGIVLPGKLPSYCAAMHTVHLEDGDAIVLHDDCPSDWRRTGPAVLIVHGLAGSHLSSYVVRLAAKLNATGMRTFRMDLRNCGAGQGLARLPYHAGRSDDLRAALEHMAALCPDAPLAAVGYSLGGNLVLKLLGEAPDALPRRLIGGVAVNPSVELAACVESLNRPVQRLYDRYFIRRMVRHLRATCRQADETGVLETAPRGMRDFDDRYTAPVCGFADAAAYYSASSAGQFVPNIRVPAHILSSRDDPLIPCEPFERIARPDHVQLHMTESGGHLGFLGRRGVDPDIRWMDWRIVEWIAGFDRTARDNTPRPVPARVTAGIAV